MRRPIALFGFFFVLIAFGTGIQTLQAQPYPDHPIQLVIPGAPGDAGDIAARLLMEELAKILKTPIVAVNKPGGAAAVGTDFVAKNRKDGYTLLYGISAGTIYSPALSPETTPYDPIRDLEPLGFHAFFPCVFSVQSEAPWKNFSEVIDYAKANPGKFRCSTLGVGSINHFQLEIIKSLTNADMTMIPFKGASPAVTGLLGGHVEATFVALAVSEPHQRSGKLRGILFDRKVPDLPDIPTLRDLGYPRDLPSPWAGLYGPAGMSEEVKRVLIPAIEKAVKTPELMAKIQRLWFLPGYKPPGEQRLLWVDDYENAKALSKKMGLVK
ncbi:MAG TPA: tripartite tricarboxylate transporter substrate binding protein [Thermodesulfobacteriota bacterium]|nr:tripartite tricarboxylate transporter substrate binding protein [Thermodesulfobacteriota bacterium]